MPSLSDQVIESFGKEFMADFISVASSAKKKPLTLSSYCKVAKSISITSYVKVLKNYSIYDGDKTYWLNRIIVPELLTYTKKAY
jgi:hypothetical protein